MRSFHPSQPAAGNNVSATLVKRLIAEIRACRPIAGIGLKARRTPQGTIMDAKPAGQPSSKTVIRDDHPWKLMPVTDETTGESKLRWMNKFLQVGTSTYNFDDEVFGSSVTGDDKTADGIYYAEVRLADSSGGLKSPPDVSVMTSATVPENNFEDGVIYFYIGRIKDEKQVSHFAQTPLIYTYL